MNQLPRKTNMEKAVRVVMHREGNDFEVWFDRTAEICWHVTRNQHPEVQQSFRSLEQAMSFIAEYVTRTQF